MTSNELLAFIKANTKPGDWVLTKWYSGALVVRHVTTEQCPVCWAATQKGVNSPSNRLLFITAGNAMGIAEDDCREVARGADSHTAALRDSVLEACHIAC